MVVSTSFDFSQKNLTFYILTHSQKINGGDILVAQCMFSDLPSQHNEVIELTMIQMSEK